MPVPRSRPHLLLLILSTIALLTALFTEPLPVRADSFVLLATYDALASAQERKAQALIIRLNMPGGLDPSMRLIMKDLTSATISRGRLYVPVQRACRVCLGVYHHGRACCGNDSRYKYRCGSSCHHGRERNEQDDEGEGEGEGRERFRGLSHIDRRATGIERRLGRRRRPEEPVRDRTRRREAENRRSACGGYTGIAAAIERPL